MKTYEFGDENKPVILLLPGTCCHWKATFGEVIPLLKRSFYVACVSYDGFDETEGTVFPSMIEETEKMEGYIQERFEGRICCAYGCSLGGSFVGLLVQRGRVHIDHGILGSSDLDQGGPLAASLKGHLMAPILQGMLRKGKLPNWMNKWVEKRPAEERDYYDKMLSMFGIGTTRMAFAKRESIYNQFYSDLVTPLNDQISADGTAIHCFYATKMGEQYEARYRLHFADPDVIRHDLQHEELLVCYPEQWVNEVENCCGILTGERG
ncbi:MAG: alpha/beta hydrolase [Lachnospiraceae bacterium]|nr:alpha/beta hydrolase [Lachnospiraceae bacterium]